MANEGIYTSFARTERDVAVVVHPSFIEAVWDPDFSGNYLIAFHLHFLVIIVKKVRFFYGFDEKIFAKRPQAEMQGVRVSCELCSRNSV